MLGYLIKLVELENKFVRKIWDAERLSSWMQSGNSITFTFKEEVKSSQVNSSSSSLCTEKKRKRSTTHTQKQQQQHNLSNC